MENLHTFVVLAYKESPFLEKCIESVLDQNYPSKVVIATSTPNKFIDSIATSYDLQVFINESGKGIGPDFDFALNCGQTKLVTIAHQDDIYEKNYSKRMVDQYLKKKKTLIIVSKYYEIRDDKKIFSNTNLKIKSLLLSPLKLGALTNLKLIKRLPIAFGNSLCCPAVTFAIDNLKQKKYFDSDMKSNIDWVAWERISKESGSFSYIPEALMGHRVHEDSTTSSVINDNIRSREDFEMFTKFWPKFIARMLSKVYQKSEDNNRS